MYLELINVRSESVTVGQTVHSFISSTLVPDVSTQSIASDLLVVKSVVVNMSNIDLNRSMVLGCDQPVSGRAGTVRNGTICKNAFELILTTFWGCRDQRRHLRYSAFVGGQRCTLKTAGSARTSEKKPRKKITVPFRKAFGGELFPKCH